MIKKPPPQRSIDTTAYNRDLYKQMYGQTPGTSVTLPVAPYDHTDYSSVDKYNDKQILEFLKRPDFDPSKLKNPIHQLSAQMYRWSQIVKNVDSGKYTDEQKAIILDQAYARMIGPALARTGQDPNKFLPVWRAQAWERGRNWNIDIQYQNNILQGNLSGIAGLAVDALQVGKNLTNFFGALVSPPKPITDESWDKQLKYTAANVNNPVGFFDQLQAVADTTSPKIAKLRAALQKQSDKVEFFQALSPNRSYTSKATSLAVEAVPFAAASALMPEGLTAEGVGSLDVLIGTSRAGRLAAGFLENAASGFVYGTLTSKEDDRAKAFRDAASWAVAGTVLHIGGMSVLWLGGKLVSVGTKAAADALAKHANMGKLIEEGRTEASPEEVEHESEVGRSELISGYGMAGARSADNAAAAHILRMEQSGMSDEEIKQFEINLLKNGTPADRQMLDSAFRIRSAMVSDTLGTATREQKSNILARLTALNGKAAGKLTKNVAVLQEVLKQRFMSMDPKKLDKNVLSYLMQQVAPTLGPNAKPEDVAKAAQELWAKHVVEATKYAEEQLQNDPFKEAKKAVSRRNQAEKEQAKAVGVVTRTRRTVNKKGEPGVSYSVNPAWMVYAKNAVKQSGKKWNSADIKDWLKDLDVSDFATDLYTFFMPQFLRDAGMHFEPGSTTGGKDHSNLFAFMYNFREHMPKEYAERLDEELGDSPKFTRFYDEIKNNPSMPDAQKKSAQMDLNREHALIAWNHMDNLLGSGRFPKEYNYFRSTDTDMNNPTVWMRNLFEERVQKEVDVINKMYAKNTPANQNAKNILKVFFQQRREAYNAGKQADVKLTNEAISTIIREASEGKRGTKNLAFRVEKEINESIGTRLHSIELTSVDKFPTTAEEEEAKKLYADNYIKAEQEKLAASEARKKAFQAYIEFRTAVIMQTNKIPPDEFNPMYAVHQEAIKRDEKAGRDFVEAQFPSDTKALLGKKIWERDVQDVGKLGGAVRKDKDGRVTIWLGHRLMDAYNKAVNTANYMRGGTVWGENVGHDSRNWTNSRIKIFLSGNRKEQDALIHLFEKGFNNAGPGGVNVVKLQPSIRATIHTSVEERTHDWQRVLAGGDILKLFDKDTFDKLHAMIPKGMQDFLNKNYPGRKPEEHVIEASAKAICKKPEMHGMTQDEAIDFVWSFFEEIHKKYGKSAFDKLTTGYRVMKDLKGFYEDAQ